MFKQRFTNFLKALGFKSKHKDSLKALVKELFEWEDIRAGISLDFDHAFNRARFTGVEGSHEQWNDAVNSMNKARQSLYTCNLKIKQIRHDIDVLIKE